MKLKCGLRRTSAKTAGGRKGDNTMFDSLEKNIEMTENAPKTRERLVRFLGAALVALVVLGGLYMGLMTLE